MDAKAWNGDVDDRDFSAPDEICPSCGAGSMEPCEAWCGCESCRNVRDRLRREASQVDSAEPDLLEALKLKGAIR